MTEVLSIRFVLCIFFVSGAVVLFSTILQRKTVPVWIDGESMHDTYNSLQEANASNVTHKPVHVAAIPHNTKIDEAISAPAPAPVDVEDEDWPPLDSLIGDNVSNVIGDVQFMLDFALVGHAKTASTFTMEWLAGQDEVAMYKHEVRSLGHNRPAELISQLYELPQGRYYKRGYKNPNDIKNGVALGNIAKYFPQTKLVVGLRHPVLWFESFYNYRARKGHAMPPAETLIGKVTKESAGVSTDESKFHLHLDNLGKTDRSSEEKKILSRGHLKRPRLPKMSNPVFLYDLNQISDKNETRVNQYRSDLKKYLGLRNDLQPIKSSHTSKNFHFAIDICEDKYGLVREDLMKNAREASIWIRKYFLKSPDVVVSSPEYFNELLETWLVDPCVHRRRH